MKIALPHLRTGRAITLLRIASGLALVALALMVWSVLDPTPAPVLIALMVGQVVGTASFVTYLVIVAWDVRRLRRGGSMFDASTSLPPPAPKDD